MTSWALTQLCTRVRPHVSRALHAMLVSVVLTGSVVAPFTILAQSSPDAAECQPPAPPTVKLPSVVRIAERDGGEPMELELRFRATSGAPLRSPIVYVYHANATGNYVPSAGASGCLRFHGALHAWARPDSSGLVTVRSIRPGPYPNSREPAHVHVVVQFPGRRGFYLNDLLFDDDPRLTPAVRAAQQAAGGSGVVRATRGRDGVWRAQREIVLQPPTR